MCNIPSTVNGKPVTAIGDQAFAHCGALASVSIPDSVTSIGNWAFYQSESLTTITIGKGVTAIGENTFSGCDGLEKIIVEEGNSKYSSQDGILYDKAQRTFIHIPKSIKGAITIPDSVTSIGEQTFGYYNGLTSVTIGGEPTKIGKYAFQFCVGLESVTRGSGVTSIGDGAFVGCEGLTSITIPASVTSIGKDAFMGCNTLNEAHFLNPNGWVASEEQDMSSTEAIPGLEDPQQAAKHLTMVQFCDYYWKREE